MDFSAFKSHVSGSLCKKCSDKAAAVVLRERDVYCINCLQLSVTHKFRSCLGKSHLMKSGERVLLAYSGGPSSSAMLMLTKEGFEETAHKRLRFHPVVVYVDECELLHLEPFVRDTLLQEIVLAVRKSGFPFYITSLEKVMRKSGQDNYFEVPTNESPVRFPFDSSDEEVAQLKRLFDSVKSLTCKEDLQVKLRHRLLCDIARSLGCAKIFLGDSESRISVRVLSDIAQGKGRNISLACGFVDDRFGDVLLLRPMREMLLKEISYFVDSKQIPTVTVPTITTKHDGTDSIQHLTESFVFGLQGEFPATVSTIFRTGDKMCSEPRQRQDMKALAAEGEGHTRCPCVLCFAPLDCESDAAQCFEMENGCKESHTNESAVSCSKPQKLQKYKVESHLCYSCRLVLHELASVDALPVTLLADATQQIQLENSFSSIKRGPTDLNS